MIDQHRLCRTQGIVPDSVKIGHGDDVDMDDQEEAVQADDALM